MPGKQNLPYLRYVDVRYSTFDIRYCTYAILACRVADGQMFPTKLGKNVHHAENSAFLWTAAPSFRRLAHYLPLITLKSVKFRPKVG